MHKYIKSQYTLMRLNFKCVLLKITKNAYTTFWLGTLVMILTTLTFFYKNDVTCKSQQL